MTTDEVGWSKHAHRKSKVLDSRRLVKIEKSPYRSYGLTDRHEVWHRDDFDHVDPWLDYHVKDTNFIS